MSAHPSLSRPRIRAIDAPGPLDVLEEAAFLLRRLPAAALACYLAGTVPMLVGALYSFATLTDRVRGSDRVAEAALGLVALYAWMKAAQAVAAEHALAVLEQRPPAPLRARDWLAIAAQQLRIHAYGLVALPLSLVLVVPGGWILAFLQNCTVLGVSSRPNLVRLSWRQARLWPLQNFRSLGVLLLFAFFGFLNLALAIYAVPWLLRTLLGLDTLFATGGWNGFNTTLLATAAALTYLAIDPWCKAMYVLRCFHGHARHTGIDLLVRARAALAAPAAAAVVLAVSLLILADANRTLPAADVEAAPAEGIAAGDLDGALDEVLAAPEYDWRLRGEEEDTGPIARFISAVQSMIQSMFDAIGRFIDWLSADDLRRQRASEGGGVVAAIVDLLVPVMIVLIVVAVLWLAWRWWVGNGMTDGAPAAPAVAVAEVVADERATADQLPEDEWLRLARELLERGEHRLAVRAFFLGSLAALARRGFLVLVRHKSNRDYERELTRRGGAAALSAAFQENRRILERTWYGREIVGNDDLHRIEGNVQAFLGGGP